MEPREISLIIPCRNEISYIAGCLDSVIANDYPREKLDIIVVDGMSEDGTKEIVDEYISRYPFIRLLDNPKKIIPTAMNIGIRNARGSVIMKIDAHSSYERHYISKCVNYLMEYGADNVGGIVKMLPRKDTVMGKSIVMALTSLFGAGNAYFRTGAREPRWVDTAFTGCYRKEVFDRVGLYDENIARSEDVAINSRLRRAGGKILLVPEIVSSYYTRSTLGDFVKHNFDNGFWITYPLKYHRLLFSWRHLVPMAFVSSLIVSLLLAIFYPLFLWVFIFILGAYLLASIYFSARLALREKNSRYLFVLPVVFGALHIVYGLGSIYGLIRTLVSREFWKSPQLKQL
jgi:glycosyltransferase involved in cell wall biosynthesis